MATYMLCVPLDHAILTFCERVSPQCPSLEIATISLCCCVDIYNFTVTYTVSVLFAADFSLHVSTQAVFLQDGPELCYRLLLSDTQRAR